MLEDPCFDRGDVRWCHRTDWLREADLRVLICNSRHFREAVFCPAALSNGMVRCLSRQVGKV